MWHVVYSSIVVSLIIAFVRFPPVQPYHFLGEEAFALGGFGSRCLYYWGLCLKAYVRCSRGGASVREAYVKKFGPTTTRDRC